MQSLRASEKMSSLFKRDGDCKTQVTFLKKGQTQ